MPRVTGISPSSSHISGENLSSPPVDTRSEPSSTSAKRMGLIFGDAFIKNDPSLEGWDPQITTEYWKLFLQKSKNQKLALPIQCQEDTLSSLEGDLHDCQVSSQYLRSNQTAELLQAIDKGLKERGRFALSLAYVGKEGGSGHAFACVLERNKKGEIHAHLMNKGEGIESHPVIGIDGDGKIKRSYRHVPIKLKDKALFSSKEDGSFHPAAKRFLDYLAAYQQPPAIDQEPYSSQEIYDYFLCIGTVDHAQDMRYEDVSITPQRSGTCSEQLCRMILRYGLTKDDASYKRMMVSFKYQALFDGLHSSDVSTKMLLLCKHSFAQTVGKAYTEGILTKEEYDLCLSLCNKVDEKAEKYPILDSSQSLPPLEAPYTLTKVEHSISKPGLNSPKESPFQARPPLILSQCLPQSFREEIHKIPFDYKRESTNRNRAAVFSFVKELPIPLGPDGEEYWSTIPETDILPILSKLKEIMEEYSPSESSHDDTRTGNGYADRVLFCLSCYAIADYLAHRLPSLHLKGFDTSIAANPLSPCLILRSGQDRERYQHLQAYFNHPQKGIRLFEEMEPLTEKELQNLFGDFKTKNDTSHPIQKRWAYAEQSTSFPKEANLETYMRHSCDAWTGDKEEPSRLPAGFNDLFYLFEYTNGFCDSSSLYVSKKLCAGHGEVEEQGKKKKTLRTFQSRRFIELNYGHPSQYVTSNVDWSGSKKVAVTLSSSEENDILTCQENEQIPDEIHEAIPATIRSFSGVSPIYDKLGIFGDQISLEVRQELHKAYEKTSLRIGATLQFIERYGSAFNDQGVRSFVEVCLFHDDQLIQKIRSEPPFLDELRCIIHEKIKECRSPHLRDQALYWIRIAYYMETHAARLSPDKQIPQAIIEELDNEIVSLESTQDPSTYYDFIIHRILIRSHLENPSEKDLAEIYALRVALTCVNCSLSKNPYALDTLNPFLIKHLPPALEVLTKKENASHFFSYLSRYAKVASSDLSLTCSSSPLLTQGNLVFNLFSGELYQNGERVSESTWTENSLAYKEKFFPGLTPRVTIQSDGSLIGLDIPFRLHPTKANTYQFIKKIGDRWWWFSESTANIPHQLLDPKLVPGCSQNHPLRCWISEDDPKSVLITDDHDHVIYTIDQEGGVHRTFVTFTKEKRNEVLCDPPEGLRNLLRTIWKEDEIFVWGEKVGETITPRHIEFPSLHQLSFTIEQKENASFAACDRYHGYVLSNPQGCPELGGLAGTLTIEKVNDPTKRIVLIPVGQLNSDLYVEGEKPTISHEKMIDENRLLTFEIDPENGHLIPEGEDHFRSYLYLIDILMRDKKYEKAAYYIKRIQQERPFSEADWILFADIAKGARLGPESSSLVLQLSFMLLNPKVFFKSSSPIKEETRSQFLTSLLDHFNFIQSLSGSKEILKIPKEHQLSAIQKRELARYILASCEGIKKNAAQSEELRMQVHFIEEVTSGIFYADSQAANHTMRPSIPLISMKEKITIFKDALIPKLSLMNIFFPFFMLYRTWKETCQKIKEKQESEYEIGWYKVEYKPAVRINLNRPSSPFDLKSLLERVKNEKETVSVVDLDLVNLRHQRCERKLGYFINLLEAIRLKPRSFTTLISGLETTKETTFDSSLLGKGYEKAVDILSSLNSSRNLERKRVPVKAPFLREKTSTARRFQIIRSATPVVDWEDPLGKLAERFFQPEMVDVLQEKKFHLPNKTFSHPLASKKLEALQRAHMETNATSRATKYSLKEPESVGELQTTLSSLIRSTEDLCAAIEILANKDDSSSLSKSEKQMHVHFGSLQRITMDNGILSTIIAGDSAKLKTLNPCLSDDDCDEIYRMTIDYLIQSSQSDQAKSALEAAKKGNYQECGEILSRKRHYNPYENPLLCLYEYATGNMFRETPNQARLLLKIFDIAFKEKQTDQSQSELRRLFFEFQAGGGKTKVISAIIAARAYYDGKLPVFFSLPEIFDIVKGDLRSTLSQVFERKVDVIDLRLNSHPTIDQLRALFKQTQTALKEGRCQVMTPESYHSIFLELQTALKNKDRDKVSASRQLLDFYKQHAVFLIDESHRNVDSLLQANVASGKPRLIPADERQLYLACYDILIGQKVVYLDDGRPIHDVLNLRQNRQALTSKGDLEKIFRQLAKNLVDEYEIHTDLDPLLNKMLPTSPWNQLNKDQRRLLCLIRGLCTEILPHCLVQVEGMDHGPSIHPGDPIDAPRRFKNPSTSKFESPDIATSLTIQGYYQRGLQNISEWRKLLFDLHKKFQDELNEYHEPERCPTYNQFLSWQIRKPPLPISLFDEKRIQDDAFMNKIMESIDPKNPQVVRTYLEFHVLPRIIIFPHKMTSTAQDLVRGCSSSILFSATLGHKGQNPLVKDNEHYLEDVAFQADVMNRSCMPHNGKIHWMDESTPRNMLDGLWEKNPQYFSTLDGIINLGGWAKYSSNLDWAREWLQFSHDKNLDFEGVLFKQESPTAAGSLGEKVYYLLLKGHEEPIRLTTGDIGKELSLRGCGEKRIAKIYGPDDTTGTDLQLEPNAKMILTVGEGTTASALVQAIMRERQFLKSPIDPEKAQSLLWVLPTPLQAKMEEVIGPVSDSPEDCWLWTIFQEAKREEASIIACAIQEIDGVLRNHALTKIEQGQGTFKTYQGLFEKELGRDVEALYGTVSIQINTGEFLKCYLKKQMDAYQIQLLPAEKQTIDRSIEKAVSAVPETLSPVHDDLSNAAEQEQVQVQESRTEAKAEKKAQSLEKPPNPKKEMPYATDHLALSTDLFWNAPVPTLNERLKTSVFPSSLTVMDNAWGLNESASFLKPTDRFLLVGKKQGDKWFYEYRAISKKDAEAYQAQILEGKTKGQNRRIALVLATGVLEQNGQELQGIPQNEWRALQETEEFKSVIASLEFFNGNPRQVNQLKSMIQNNPTEWRKVKDSIQSRTFDPNRLANRLLDDLFPKVKGPVKETFFIKTESSIPPPTKSSFFRRFFNRFKNTT